MIIDEKFKEEWDKNEPHVYLGKKTEDILMNEKYLNEDLKIHLGTHIHYLNKYYSNLLVKLKRNTEPDFMMRSVIEREREVTVGKLIHKIKYDTFTMKVPWFNVYDTMYKLAKKYYKGGAYDENHQLYKDLLSPFDFLNIHRRGEEKKWNSPSDNPLYKWTQDWEYKVHPINHSSLRCFMKARLKEKKKYLKNLVEAKLKEKERLKKEAAEAIEFKKKQEKGEILKQKYSNVYESLDNKDYECYAICEKENFFTKERNKSNCLYIGKTSNFASRRKSYRDFRKPNNEIVNKLVKKFPKKARDGIIMKLINNIRVKRFKFKCLQDEKYLDHVEGYLIQRINPLLNTSKSNGRRILYKSRSFSKFVLNGGLDEME